MFSILVKFESEFLWIITDEKHKARDLWDRHISAELPTQKGHSLFPYYTENLHLAWEINFPKQR